MSYPKTVQGLNEESLKFMENQYAKIMHGLETLLYQDNPIPLITFVRLLCAAPALDSWNEFAWNRMEF